MESIVLMFIILFLIICLAMLPIIVFCYPGQTTTKIYKPKKKANYTRNIILNNDKYIENFTPSYIQVFPSIGSKPLIVTFVPTYVNDFTPFTVDFGDTTKYIGKTNDVFTHSYDTIGVYNGTILFQSLDRNNIATKSQQNFQITVQP